MKYFIIQSHGIKISTTVKRARLCSNRGHPLGRTEQGQLHGLILRPENMIELLYSEKLM